ncbi:MAG: ELM1/GtrOC1 family putative glycosyltransferase [Gammaproteobacteria bacterium]
MNKSLNKSLGKREFMDRATKSPRTWLVLGDKKGDNGQVEAVAAGLPWPWERRFVQMRPEWVYGKPPVRPSLDHIDRDKSDPLEPPWPDLVLTVGRRPSSVALWIQQQSGGHTRIVYLGKPSTRIERFDLVAVSREILMPPMKNVIRTELPLMRVSRDQAELAQWRERFADLPKPLVGFLLGGPTKPFVFNRKVLQRVLALAGDVTGRQGGTAYLSTSRRTPAWFADALANDLPAGARLFRWSPDATDNPYRGILGLADGLVVTADSISMLVEAIGLGQPAAVLPLPVGIAGKLDMARRDALAWLFATPEDGAGRWRQGLARSLYRARLVYQSRHFPAFQRHLVRVGQAVWAGQPFIKPTASPQADVEHIVERIRLLMAA